MKIRVPNVQVAYPPTALLAISLLSTTLLSVPVNSPAQMATTMTEPNVRSVSPLVKLVTQLVSRIVKAVPTP